MLDGDRKCPECDRTIYSYTKCLTKLDTLEWRCPYCRKWIKYDNPKDRLDILIPSLRKEVK